MPVARTHPQAANVPCVPGSDGLVLTEKDVLDCVGKIGLPIMIKATAGACTARTPQRKKFKGLDVGCPS